MTSALQGFCDEGSWAWGAMLRACNIKICVVRS